MRIAAISDLHVGVRADRDSFGHDPDRFAAFLDRLEAEHDTIVLVGDIYQADHTAVPSPVGTSHHLQAAKQRLGPLARRLAAPPYRYLYGNHDAVAGVALGAPEWIRLHSDSVAALFIHGHQFDPVAQRAPVAAHAGTWICGRLRAAGLRPIATYLERRDVEIKDERFRREDGPYLRAAIGLAAEHAAQIVVMGHTHVACITPFRRGLHVNTGTCSGGRLCYASIDTAERSVTVVADGKTEVVSL